MGMGIFFLLQTVVGMFIDPEAADENSAAKQSRKSFSYEEAVELQKQEGGALRYYGEDEFDYEAGRVADENGNPIVRDNAGSNASSMDSRVDRAR